MTGGFLSVPIMRPHRRWTVLQVYILAGLLLTLNADSEDSNCEVEVKVLHNTVYEVCLGKEVRIFCTVTFCNDPPPGVSWYKREENEVPVDVGRHVKTEWELLKHLEGRSILIFQKIGRNDSGAYQCQSVESLSHYIEVTVRAALDCTSDGRRTNVTQKNDSRSTILDPKPTEDLWRYMYVAAGIVALVIAVIVVSVVSMRGCKGKSKKETQTENQFIAIPMVEQPFEQPFPHARRQASPKGNPSAPPCRRSTRRKTPPSRPHELPLPRDDECVYSDIEKGRERGGNVAEEEEGSSIVYAALNHQLPAGGAARPRRPKEEMSEYAAIRVKDPSSTGLNVFKSHDFPH